MINSVSAIDAQIKSRGAQPAMVFPGEQPVSFSQLADMASRVQTALLRKGLQPGQAVLLAIDLSPALYATIIACARLGLTLTLVEPWMPLDRIEQAVALLKPQAFLSGNLGLVWGARVKAIRSIPVWLHTRHLLRARAVHTECLLVDPEHPCIVTFTTGSTGKPKGVVRTHSYLLRQRAVVDATMDTSHFQGSDLVVFANMALDNLANGRCSLIVPAGWSPEHLKILDHLPAPLQAESGVGGPAFMKLLLQSMTLPKLKAYFVGGALADCSVFESVLARWPDARTVHVYGSTEAEPVAFGPLRRAVDMSRARGYYQVLASGSPCPGMNYFQEGDQTWISGSHVCPEYLGDGVSNQQNKRRDESGTLWHRMGDRIEIAGGDWWYQGREQQIKQDFLDEQRLYSALDSSEAMIDRNSNGEREVYCADAKNHARTIKALLPDVKTIYHAQISRDRRHRARIDRDTTRKAKKWIVG